jgi:hypothetical protein
VRTVAVTFVLALALAAPAPAQGRADLHAWIEGEATEQGVRPVVLARAKERALDRFIDAWNKRWRSRTVCAARADNPACVSTG